ncbi:hypothetical protein HBB04_03355 [Pseudomonas coronafaciens]|nr:hypothetical protein HBB04_03355 [Pseudomonas coronafaciens]
MFRALQLVLPTLSTVRHTISGGKSVLLKVPPFGASSVSGKVFPLTLIKTRLRA